MQDLRISFIQTDLFWRDSSSNLKNFDKKINQIEEDTDIIVLPEMFNTGFVVEPETLDDQAAQDGHEWMKMIAARTSSVVCGSMIVHENGNYFNRFFWVSPNGNTETYDKRHLFSFGGEDKHFSSGKDYIIIDYKGWKIKPLICYDLRFPVWSKNTYENNEFSYDLLIYVANWPAARSYVWKSLLVARALENQAFVVGVNRIGKDGRETPYDGFSGVIEPKGEWISEEVNNIESVQTIKLSKEKLVKFRKKFNVALDWDKFDLHY